MTTTAQVTTAGQMPNSPEFIYNEEERSVSAEVNDAEVEIYSDVSRKQFELIKEVDLFVTEASGLLDELIHWTHNQFELTADGSYYTHLNDLQYRAAEHYRQCVEYQDAIKENGSEPETQLLGLLYKLEKFLRHYFRALTVGQSLAFSQRLGVHFVRTDDYLFLYTFVRNVCSTMEFLGKKITNRIGPEDEQIGERANAAKVYKKVKQQGLDEVFGEEQTVHVPPTGQEMRMDEVGLSSGLMEYLWDKPCEIVHNCPLVVAEEDTDHLPEEVVSTSVITEEDVVKLTHLSFRLHYHSVSMFLNFTKSYLDNMIEAMVRALYHEQ